MIPEQPRRADETAEEFNEWNRIHQLNEDERINKEFEEKRLRELKEQWLEEAERQKRIARKTMEMGAGAGGGNPPGGPPSGDNDPIDSWW